MYVKVVEVPQAMPSRVAGLTARSTLSTINGTEDGGLGVAVGVGAAGRGVVVGTGAGACVIGVSVGVGACVGVAVTIGVTATVGAGGNAVVAPQATKRTANSNRVIKRFMSLSFYSTGLPLFYRSAI